MVEHRVKDPKVRLHQCHNIVLALSLQKVLLYIMNRSNLFIVGAAPSGTLMLKQEVFSRRIAAYSGALCHNICFNVVCIHLEMFTFAHGTTIH